MSRGDLVKWSTQPRRIELALAEPADPEVLLAAAELLLADAAGADEAGADVSSGPGTADAAAGVTCCAASSARTCETRVAARYLVPLLASAKAGDLSGAPAADPSALYPGRRSLPDAALDAGAAALGAELEDEDAPREMT